MELLAGLFKGLALMGGLWVIGIVALLVMGIMEEWF